MPEKIILIQHGDVTDGNISQSVEKNIDINFKNKSGIDDLMEGIIDTILAKEKLNEIYQMLDSIVGGQIIKQTDGRYYLQTEGFAQPIFVNNLSAGLKSFVIIKMLLERGAIRERDVLIPDEPEIHLHPQWQIAYAEIF